LSARKCLSSAVVAFGLVAGAIAEPALGQALAGQDYGGAAFGTRKHGFDPLRAQVAIRVAPNGRSLRIDFHQVTPCPGGRFDFDTLNMTTALEVDGNFADRASRVDRFGALRRVITLDAEGQIVGSRASGRARLTITSRTGRRRATVCVGRLRAWQARARQPAGSAFGAPLAGTGYFGTTAQHGKTLPYAFSLVVASNATAVRQAIFSVRKRCPGLGPSDFTNISPPFAVKPDGSFSAQERFPEYFNDAVERSTVRLSGRFRADGSVAGQVRLRSVVQFRRGHRVVRCDTGLVSWSARTTAAS
jgi:hypothetical protein